MHTDSFVVEAIAATDLFGVRGGGHDVGQLHDRAMGAAGWLWCSVPWAGIAHRPARATKPLATRGRGSASTPTLVVGRSPYAPAKR